MRMMHKLVRVSDQREETFLMFQDGADAAHVDTKFLS